MTTTSKIYNLQSTIYNNLIFPNPAKQYFTIEYKIPSETITNAVIEIQSIDGRLIKQIPLKNSQFQLIIDIKEYAKGVYLIVLKNNGTVIESAKVTIIKN